MLLKVVIITVVVLALLGGALLLRKVPRDASPIGFRDAVKDPDRLSIETKARNRERLAVRSEKLDDDALRQCVADLLERKKARLARLRLEHHGARAIGAEREAAALEQAFGLFGRGGPSPDRGLRQKQLARLARSSDEDLDDVEEKFPELPRDVEKLLLLYAIAHKDAFR